METATNIASNVAGIVIFALVLIIALCWILFPILLLGKVGSVVKELERLNSQQAVRHEELVNATNKTVQNTAIIAAATSPQTKITQT